MNNENFQGPEVVGSSLYQKNIGAKFTHFYRPSLCWEIVVDCHNLGHPNAYCGSRQSQDDGLEQKMVLRISLP